jgi:O-antigen/teichoic acid export membrane protein
MTEEHLKSFEKLAKGSYFLILDNIVNLSLGALFWIVLAKLVDAAPLGQAMVAVAFATSVIGFAGYGVQVTISKYMSEYNAKGLPKVSKRILSLGIKLALIVSASVAVVIALLSGYIASEAYNDASMTPVLVLAVLTFLPSQTVVSALMGAYQGAHKMKFALMTDSIYQVIRLGIAVFLVMAAFGSFGIILSFAVASIIASVLGYVYFVPRLFAKGAVDGSLAPSSAENETGSEIRGIRQIIKFSGHNYAAVGMKTLTAQIGVLIVGTQNFELAAFYGLSVLISNLVGGVLNAVSRALLPTATEEWTKGNKVGFGRTLDTGIRLSMLISGIGFLVLMVQPNQVLGLISDQYVEASDALRILVVSSIIYSLGAIITSMLNAANRAADVAKIGITSSGITIILTFVLTPIMYIEGAAVALLIGSIASLAMSMISLRSKEGITVSARSTLRPAFAMIAGVGVGFAVMTIFPNMIVLSLGSAIGVYLGVSMALRVTTRREIRRLAGIMQKGRT